MQKTHVDIEKSTLDKLDEWVEELRAETPGGSGITRADLVRDILRRAVAAREKSTPKKASPKTPAPKKRAR